MKMIFEIRDLNYATPATATRAGIVCMSDVEGVQWRSYVTSWIKKQEHPEPIKDQLAKYFEKYGNEALYWFLKNTKILVPMVDINMISACCSLLENLITPDKYEVIEYWFIFCFTSAVGFCLCEVDGVDYRKHFSDWWKGEMKTIKYPSKGRQCRGPALEDPAPTELTAGHTAPLLQSLPDSRPPHWRPSGLDEHRFRGRFLMRLGSMWWSRAGLDSSGQ